MKRVSKRGWLIGILVGVALVTIACQPTRSAFEVTNDSGRVVDFVYSEDFLDLSDFGRDYDSLSIGDRDTYQGCTQCDMAPGAVYNFEEPFRERQSVTIAAREADSNVLIFKRRYTWQELFDLDFRVFLVDQS